MNQQNHYYYIIDLKFTFSSFLIESTSLHIPLHLGIFSHPLMNLHLFSLMINLKYCIDFIGFYNYYEKNLNKFVITIKCINLHTIIIILQ